MVIRPANGIVELRARCRIVTFTDFHPEHGQSLGRQSRSGTAVVQISGYPFELTSPAVDREARLVDSENEK